MVYSQGRRRKERKREKRENNLKANVGLRAPAPKEGRNNNPTSQNRPQKKARKKILPNAVLFVERTWSGGLATKLREAGREMQGLRGDKNC